MCDDFAKKRLILLVDDEPALRKVGAQMLEVLGYRVVLAEDGRDGVERFQEHHHELSLVLLDMIMPNMGGQSAFEAMRSIDELVPIILCSGYVDSSTVSLMLAQGLAGFLAKPYRFAQLLEQLEKVASASRGSAKLS